MVVMVGRRNDIRNHGIQLVPAIKYRTSGAKIKRLKDEKNQVPVQKGSCALWNVAGLHYEKQVLRQHLKLSRYSTYAN
jgi:hypothetical protein